MVAITNTTSLTFLKEAIDTTLSEAEASLEAFAEDRGDAAVLDQCASAFHQLRGISQVLELSAATLMSEEMELATEALKRQHDRVLVQALGNAIVLLGRYFEYVQLKDRAMPEMLIGGINELRRAGGKSLIQESHFFSVDLSRAGTRCRRRGTRPRSRPRAGACATCTRWACWACCAARAGTPISSSWLAPCSGWMPCAATAR
ncbi:hypothetical protein ASALC70_00195 [Alcanivorax sp. ALC70]|nr:hypothetical protein ASALC70_00195 [Alcanivorax sp. ALC70]